MSIQGRSIQKCSALQESTLQSPTDPSEHETLASAAAPSEPVPSTSSKRQQPLRKRKSVVRGGRKKKAMRSPVYICPVCSMRAEDPDESTDSSQFCIMCDACAKWYHWGCVGICETSKELEGDYTCLNCKT